jgi:hypothetical protein
MEACAVKGGNIAMRGTMQSLACFLVSPNFKANGARSLGVGGGVRDALSSEAAPVVDEVEEYALKLSTGQWTRLI